MAKKLKRILKKHSGRDSQGHVAMRHIGGRQKRFMRVIDFERDKFGVQGRVEAIEYDPNRTANLALVLYKDGDRRYILATDGLSVGDIIESGPTAPVKSGNALPLAQIPVGSLIHNLEIRPGKGGQMVRGAGSFAVVQGREDHYIIIKLPSGELRRFVPSAYATLGQIAKVERGNLRLAGRVRRMGRRPTVRGTAMHPAAHPHGGGEGRSPEGMPPKTPWGKQAKGVKTRKHKKYSDFLIIKRRKIGYGSPN